MFSCQKCGVTLYSTKTLKDLDGVYRLRVHCSSVLCHHNAPVNIKRLRDRLGDEFLTCDLAGRMRCTACGGRKILTIISPIDTGQCR